MGRSVCFTIFILTVIGAVCASKNYLDYISLDEIEDGATYSFDFEDKYLTRINASSCVKPGPICDGCESVYECILIGSGFIIEFLNNCPAGSTCLESSGACTTEANPICDEIGYNFTCRQVGVFPDAFNCQKYHLCIPNDNSTTVRTESLEQKCNANFYYDPKTALCRNKLAGSRCDPVATPCVSAGEAGVVSANPALYYICLRGENSENFLPQMFSCQDNWIYDVNTKACFDPSPKPATGTNGLCTEVGNFYDSTSVFFYFSCSTVGGSPLRRACETNKRFNHARQECVDITWKDFDLYDGIIP